MDEHETREALRRHWAASDANDFETEHDIYREDAVLEYPQSGERIRGRRNILASRVAQPNAKRFEVRRVVGAGDLWVTEFVLRARNGSSDPEERRSLLMRRLCRAAGRRLLAILSPRYGQGKEPHESHDECS